MNVQSGTGTAANYGCPAAGKTGTTDEAKDAWFVGYTPHLSTAVWVGYPDAGIAMPGAQGGTYAAPVWHAFMLPATATTATTSRSPTEPLESHPFFGKYSSTGSSGYSSSDDGYGPDHTDGTDGTGTGGQGSTRTLLRVGAAAAPDVQVPPAGRAAPPAGRRHRPPASSGRGAWPSSS